MSYQVEDYWYCNPSQLNMFMPGVSISQKIREENSEIKNKQPCGCEEAMKKCLNRETQNDSFCCDFDETSIYEYDCECLRQKKSCF
jgi:hypothetical protein